MVYLYSDMPLPPVVQSIILTKFAGQVLVKSSGIHKIKCANISWWLNVSSLPA